MAKKKKETIPEVCELHDNLLLSNDLVRDSTKDSQI
jgi:hypothetical protein